MKGSLLRSSSIRFFNSLRRLILDNQFLIFANMFILKFLCVKKENLKQPGILHVVSKIV